MGGNLCMPTLSKMESSSFVINTESNTSTIIESLVTPSHTRVQGHTQSDNERKLEYLEANYQGDLIATATAPSQQIVGKQKHTSTEVPTMNISKEELEIAYTRNANTEQIEMTNPTIQPKEAPTYHVYPDIPGLKTFTVTPDHSTGRKKHVTLHVVMLQCYVPVCVIS